MMIGCVRRFGLLPAFAFVSVEKFSIFSVNRKNYVPFSIIDGKDVCANRQFQEAPKNSRKKDRDIRSLSDTVFSNTHASFDGFLRYTFEGVTVLR